MNLPELIAFSDYTAPTTQTEHALRLAWTRLKQRMSGPKDPVLPDALLDRMAPAAFNEVTDTPDCSPLLAAYDQQIGEWSRDAGAQPKLRTIIVPPCDTTGTLAIWAQSRGHALLPEPNRSDLTRLDNEGWQPKLTGEGLLVIPRLESWFLRERNGLHALRWLLALLASTERRCLVGCDSWAWRFIVKAAGADLVLPRPQAFEPLDALQLRDWFAGLAKGKDGVTAIFRLAGNGEDVLALNNDGELCNGYLRQLAALSLGIPWVTWHLWRADQGVCVGQKPLPDRAAKLTGEDARTVWIVGANDQVDLPPSNQSRALLVLQALLIHAALTPAEIDAVLPTTGEPDVLPALVASGHLQCDLESKRHRIRPAAYPFVRKALEAAGFPTGDM
jgi:hypothetical protein